jgi:hypothetical integral membrane protein (TIGR02206 family)
VTTSVVAASQRFEAFTGQHYLLLGLFALGCVAVVMVGRRHRGRASEVRLRRGFALVLLAFAVPLNIALLLPGEWDKGTSLPIQLCDLAWMTGAIALWTVRPWAIALTYFWALTLTVQAIITPSLGESFPDLRFFGFWGQHFLVVWAAVLLAWGLGRVPSWWGYRFTVLVTALWAVGVAGFNALADTNYGYLNRKPSSASILDLLGPWPVYVVAEIAILVVVWAMMTLPWVWLRSKNVESQHAGRAHAVPARHDVQGGLARGSRREPAAGRGRLRRARRDPARQRDLPGAPPPR